MTVSDELTPLLGIVHNDSVEVILKIFLPLGWMALSRNSEVCQVFTLCQVLTFIQCDADPIMTVCPERH